MGRWSCYWRLPRLVMRNKDRSTLSARKGWKGTKPQCVQIPGSITQPKTASLLSCPMVSFAFLPLGKALTPSDHMNPNEAWWGSRVVCQLHHMGWVSAASQPHLNGNNCWDATMWPLAMRSNFISHGKQLHLKVTQRALVPCRHARGSCAPAPAQQARGVVLRCPSPGPSEIVLKHLVSGLKFLQNNKWRLAS